MDRDALSQLLTELQRQLEGAPLPFEEKFRALEALRALAECVSQRVAETRFAFAQVAMLLEASNSVPEIEKLLYYFPVLAARHGETS